MLSVRRGRSNRNIKQDLSAKKHWYILNVILLNPVGLHIDACLGGFILPWIRKLGYAVPNFDFGVDGVTTMSADTHK